MAFQRLFAITAVLLSFLPASADTIDSLFSAYRADGRLSISEAGRLLPLLAEEDYVDSMTCPASASLKKKQLAVYSAIGYRLYDRGHFDKALSVFPSAIALAEELADSSTLAELISCRGASEMRSGALTDAVASFEHCIELAERMKDNVALSSAHNNLAFTYCSVATPSNGYAQQAYASIQKAIQYERLVPGSPALSIRYGTASEINVKLGDYPEALRMARLAWAIDSVDGNKLKMARRQSQMGDALFAMHNWDEAEQAYLLAMQLLEETGDPVSTAINCKQLGQFYQEKGDRQKAFSYYNRALQMAEDSGNRLQCEQLLLKFYEFYKGVDNVRALDYLERYGVLKDSLMDEHSQQVLRSYQARYEASEKELIISQQRTTIWRRNVAIGIISLLFALSLLTLIYLNHLHIERKKRIEAEAEILELQEVIQTQEEHVMSELTNYIAHHIGDGDLSNDSICRELAVSQSTLNRQVHNHKGCSIQAYVQQLRMEKAETLLCSTDDSVAEIATACGYNDVSYFTRVFKQCHDGTTPSSYRSPSGRDSGDSAQGTGMP